MKTRPSDPAASILVQLTDIEGQTNLIVSAVVGRDGNFLVEGLPLNGARSLNLTVTDAAGNITTTNLNVSQGSVAVTVDPVSPGKTIVTGKIDSSGYTVWVNGVKTTNNGDGTWTGLMSAIGAGGGSVGVKVISNSDNGGNGSWSGSGTNGSSDAFGNPNSDQALGVLIPVEAPKGVFISSYHNNYVKQWGWGTQKPDTYSNLAWDDGVGGSGGAGLFFGLYITDVYTWPATSWPQTLPSGTDTQTGTVVTSPPRGTPYCVTTTVGGPGLQMEQCDGYAESSGDSSSKDPWYSLFQTEHAEVKLATGGPASSTKLNLWVISASAWAHSGAAILPQSITVLGKKLGSDGLLYVMLSDNTTPVVTPIVTGSGSDYYSFSVSAQEYKLGITANGHNLETETPKFCVGENVLFSLNGLPSYDELVGNWSLPGNFVNEQYLYSSSCTSYRKNPALLQKTAQTSCWFINGRGGNVKAAFNVEFANGQQVDVIKQGGVTVYRPTLTLTNVQPRHFYTLSNTNLPTTKLRLGTDDESNIGGILFMVWINSTSASGVANITQMITASYSNPAFNFDDWRCDGSEFYRYQVRVNPSRLPSGPVGITDGPHNIWVSPNFVGLSARDFVRFKPDGSGSIWVTLGITTWETAGVAERNFQGNWSITEDTTTGPSNIDSSDEFPLWSTSVSPGH